VYVVQKISIIVLILRFISTTSFEFIFICGMRCDSESILWIWLSSFSSTISWKSCPFSTELSLYFCKNYVGDLNSNLYIQLYIYMAFFITSLCGFNYCRFVICKNNPPIPLSVCCYSGLHWLLQILSISTQF
jgi:hypothetical protein